jgi:hypothetical protein
LGAHAGKVNDFHAERTEPGIMMPELGRHIGDPDAVACEMDRRTPLSQLLLRNWHKRNDFLRLGIKYL